MSVKIDKPSKCLSIIPPNKIESKNYSKAISPLPIQNPITPSKFDISNVMKVYSDKGKSILDEIELLKLGSKKENENKTDSKNKMNSNQASFSIINNIRLKSAYKESKYFNESIARSVKLPKNVYGKGLHRVQAHKTKIGKAKMDLIKKEMDQVQSIPTLSPNTKKIIREKLSNIKPIYQRYSEVIENRKKDKETLNVKYEKPEIKINFGMYEKDRFDNWVEEKYRWSEKRRMKIMEKKIKKENEEFSLIKKFSSVPLKDNMNNSCRNIFSNSLYKKFSINTKQYEVSFATIERKTFPCHSLDCKDRNILNLKLYSCEENEANSVINCRKSVKSEKESLIISNKTSRKTKDSSNIHFTIDEESSNYSRRNNSVQNKMSKGKSNFEYNNNIYSKKRGRNNLAFELNKENTIYYNNKHRRLIHNVLGY